MKSFLIQKWKKSSLWEKKWIFRERKRLPELMPKIVLSRLDSFNRSATIGLVEIGQIKHTKDMQTTDSRITAAFSVLDGINPRSTLIPITRVEGITRAMVAPVVGANLIAGRGAIIHLGDAHSFVTSSTAAMFIALGHTGADLSGGARSAALLKLREALQDAKDYQIHSYEFDHGRRRPYALSRLDLEALIPVLERKIPVAAYVERASDIQSIIRLSKEYNFRLVLLGASEAWMVAKEIAREKVPVILNPLTNLPTSFEKLGATFKNPVLLYEAGVRFAFVSDSAHNSRNLRQAAGNAVANGLPWNEALKAITLSSAQIWNIDKSYGSIEPGKDADLVIWDGDPLEVTSYPKRIFIQGKEISMATRQTKLRDRYRNLGSPTPPAYNPAYK